MPDNVYQKGPSLYYVKKNKWIRLCRADAPEHVLHRELWKLLGKTATTLADVMDDYRANKLPTLAQATQRDYETIIQNVLKPTFGHMLPDDLTSQDIAAYLHKWEREEKLARGNRVVSCLSSVLSYGMRIRACNINPCYGVRRNQEKQKTRYVTDAELRQALKKANPALRYLLWAAYLTGYRQQDLRELRRSQLTPQGILVYQSKDGKHELREWTASLRKVVRRSMERNDSEYVFTSLKGRKWTLSGLQSALRRLDIDWTFHDLRAKADSDHETGLGLMRRYNRARRIRAVK